MDRITNILQSNAPQPPQLPTDPMAAWQAQVPNGYSNPNIDAATSIMQKAQQGNPQAIAALKASMSVVQPGDQAGANDFLNYVHNLPEQVDPTNSYQMQTIGARWARERYGSQTSYGAEMPSPIQIATQNMANIGMGKGSNIIGLEQESAKNIAMAEYKMSGGNTPAAVQIANEIAAARAAGDTQREQDLMQAAKIMKLGPGITMSGGVAKEIPNYGTVAGGLKGAEKTGTDTAALEVERRANYTKAQSALVGLKQQSNLVTSTIDHALSKISNWSTGYGSYLSGLPNTDARELENDIETIKANLGFDKLQQMRMASPTGGALGNVSDFENRLLQAINGALDPKMKNQLKKNLATIKELYPQVVAERERAFQQDYGSITPIGDNPIQPGSIPTPPAASPSSGGVKFLGFE